MNEYRFEDIKVGLEEQFCVTVTEQMLNQFAQITGDLNPLHHEEQFAQADRKSVV